MDKELEVWSAHASAAIATIVGAVALKHPGFAEQPWVQWAVTSLGMVIAGGIEVVHLVTHRKLTVTLKQIEAWGQTALANIPKTANAANVGSPAKAAPAAKAAPVAKK